jgi:hypothetical protein
MDKEILLCSGVGRENAPAVDNRSEEERERLPYFSHWERQCIDCGLRWAADDEQTLKGESESDCSENDDGKHVFGPITTVWAPNDGSHWEDWQGDIIMF